MRRYAAGKTHWLLEWYEPDEDMRWGELKSTPHHVNVIEDAFPHAWSILRGAGLSEPLQLRQVDMVNLWSARLCLRAGEATVELMFDRHAGRRRRYLRIEADGCSVELDFSEEPGILKGDGIICSEPPWDPAMRPLALELSAFLAACSGQAMPDVPVAASQSLEAVSLMEAATSAFISLQVRAIAAAACSPGSLPGLSRVIFGALCREAAMAGVRVSNNSDEGRALIVAAHALVCQKYDTLPGVSSELAAIVSCSPFLAQVRQEREAHLARPRSLDVKS